MSHFCCLVIHDEGENLDVILEPWMENCCGVPSKEYMEFFECEDCDFDEEVGARGYWQNPNARWDWYEVGGRFRHSMPLKAGGTAIEARVGEIDFGPITALHERAVDFWERAVEGKNAEGERAPFCWPPASELRRRFRDSEDYASAHDHFVPWAVVVDGEWYEQGEMGWFGLSDEPDEAEREWSLGFYDRFIKGLDPSKCATIVDCHI